MIRLLIADDHAVVRRGLTQIINEAAGMQVAAEAADGSEVIDRTRDTALDIILLDLNMPGRSGFDVLKHVKAEYPNLPVLVLSMHAEDQYAMRVLRAGASGYLGKESAPEELIRAIRRVAGGGRYVSPAVAELLLTQLDGDPDAPLHERLSDREFQVMRMLAEGVSVKEIGASLSLSVKTVSTYRSRILEKMNLKSNADLTHYALKNDLIY